MLVGPEEITAECVLLGGHGGINGGANMFPELYVDLYLSLIHIWLNDSALSLSGQAGVLD